MGLSLAVFVVAVVPYLVSSVRGSFRHPVTGVAGERRRARSSCRGTAQRPRRSEHGAFKERPVVPAAWRSSLPCGGRSPLAGWSSSAARRYRTSRRASKSFSAPATSNTRSRRRLGQDRAGTQASTDDRDNAFGERFLEAFDRIALVQSAERHRCRERAWAHLVD